MALATSPSDDSAAETADGSRAYHAALESRVASRHDRRRRELCYVAIIVTAVAAALCYGGLIAAPRYTAEARFSVRATASAASAAAPATSLIATGQPQGAGIGFVDGFAVNDFLTSRDCMERLSTRIDLPKLLGERDRPRLPWSTRTSQEQLYRAYRDAVSSRFNMLEQINVVSVSGFSPAQSQRIADALLLLAQDFVARMDARGVADSLLMGERQVRAAERQDGEAASAIAAWRIANRNIDPQAESAMVMQMVGQIEQELTAARINYEKVRALDNPGHPMLQPAQRQVAALEQQLGDARRRLAGSDTSEAARLKTYGQLKDAQAFADNNLAATRANYQQAFLDAMRLRRYLTVIARPVAEDEAGSPVLSVLALEGLLAGIVLAFVTSILLNRRRAGRC